MRRIFTLEQATGLLPWVEERLRNLDPIRDALDEIKARFSTLSQESRGNGNVSIGAEVLQVQKELEEATSKFTEVIEEINQKGIVVRDARAGLIDFLALCDQEEMFMCWLRGEESIRYWHGTNEGYSSRKPL